MYLDANVFVLAVDETAPLHAAANEALDAALRDEAETSFLAIDEAIWALRRPAGRAAAVQAGRQFMDLPGLKLLAIDAQAGRKALDLMDRLDPRDAIHAAAALATSKRILSTDPDFDAVDGLERVGLE